MNDTKLENIKNYFLSSTRNRYKILLEIFTEEELLNKPIKFLYFETISKFDLTESDIIISNFKRALARLRKNLKTKYKLQDIASTKNVEQSINSFSNPEPKKEKKEITKEMLDKWLEENPLPPPTVRSTDPKDLLKPAYPKK